MNRVLFKLADFLSHPAGFYAALAIDRIENEAEQELRANERDRRAG